MSGKKIIFVSAFTAGSDILCLGYQDFFFAAFFAGAAFFAAAFLAGALAAGLATLVAFGAAAGTGAGF